MSNVSPFISEAYTANRNVLPLALSQHALYLSRILKKDEKEIYDNLAQFFKENPEFLKSPKAKVLIKNKNEDRELKIIPIGSIFKYVEKKNYHFSPSMVGYTNADEEESINSIGTRLFIANRSFYKGLKQQAINDNDKVLEDKYDKLQNAFKIFNNAQSGAMSSEGTPINNKTGHTTLTSTTRCLTSTANLINEQFITGNRFFNTPINTLQSITARIKVTDFKLLESVMTKHGLKYPTSDDILNIVKHCSRRYWDSDEYMGYIKEFLDELNPLELASVAYTLDIPTLYQHNKEFMDTFFNEWTAVPKNYTESLEPDNKDKKVLCVSKLPYKSGKEEINKLNHYHEQIEAKYFDFLNIFFKSPIPPTGLYDVVGMVRDCVLTSDTDSSIYTIDRVAQEFSDNHSKVIRLNGVLTYMIRMITLDQHRQLSCNMNVSKKNLKILEMKNEFFYSGYVTTLMSKHYYALKRMVEGVVFETPQMDKKGVHIKGGKTPLKIREEADGIMDRVVDTIETNKLLDPAEVLYGVGEKEREVVQGIKDGEFGWLAKQSIKGYKAYKLPNSSVYHYHEMWQEVFAPKYGNAPELPYVSVKVIVDLESKSKVQEFAKTCLDKDIGERFLKFCEDHGRFKYKSINLPMENLQSIKNIPDEIKPVINFRDIIKQNFKSVYTVLESTGLYFINNKITRLVSDEH